MNRGKLYLIGWDEAAVSAMAQTLEDDGWRVRTETTDGALAVLHMMDDAPSVVAVDLSRLPSHGREAARAVRSAKTLAAMPIVFFGGSDEARFKALGAVPDATVTSEEDLKHVLARMTIRSAGR